MIRHLSVYALKYPKDLQKAAEILRQAGELIPVKEYYHVGVNPAPKPEVPGVCFGDLVQTVDFPGIAEAMAYPESEAHIWLQKETAGLFSAVTTIDFEI